MSDQSRDGVEGRDAPPRPQFALSVGIIGHRPNRLPHDATKLAKIQSDIDDVLATFVAAAQRSHADYGGLFAASGETLSLISALAEGADSMAARTAIALGLNLDVVLPFPARVYEKDFAKHAGPSDDISADIIAAFKTELAIDEFDVLIAHARSVLELPGTRGPISATKEERALAEARSYEAAGLTILSQADVIMAVWDRKPSQGRGGTPELIAEAARVGLPIIIIDAHGAEPPEVRWRNFLALPGSIVKIEDLPRRDLNTGLHKIVDELIRPPAAHEQLHALKRWLAETSSRFNLRFSYPVLMACLLTRWPRLTDFIPARPAELESEYRKPARELLAAASHAGASFGVETLARPYAWADSVAVGTAQRFRSAFVFNFFFAAVTVMVAAWAVIWMHGHPQPHGQIPFWQSLKANWFVGVEVVLIGLVVLNTWYGHREEWHRRWYEGRELAERLRAALPLWAVGLHPGSFPGEEPTWTGWYARAFVRMQGLRPGALTGGCLRAARSLLLNVLHEQRHYNEQNAFRLSRLEFRLEMVGLAAILATVLLAADHILLDSSIPKRLVGDAGPMHELGIWLSVALPALASATYGVRIIGDFEGIHQRAERTRHTLAQLIKAIDEDGDDLALLRARASAAADAMLGDVSSWRLSAESRGLAIPG